MTPELPKSVTGLRGGAAPAPRERRHEYSRFGAHYMANFVATRRCLEGTAYNGADASSSSAPLGRR